MITEEQFTQWVGRPPQDDDMERVNCDKAGEFGHVCCGWNHEQNLPVYMAGRCDNLNGSVATSSNT